MELSISYSSFRVPSFVPQRCHVSSSHGKFRLIPLINPTTKHDIKSCNFPSKCDAKNLIQPMQHYGESRFFKSVSDGQHNCNSTPARGQFKSSCSNSVFAKSQVDQDDGLNPVLDKAQIKSVGSDSVLVNILHFGSACYKFLRPYAMHQAIISAICLYGRVFVENPNLFKWPLLLKAFPGLIAIMLAQAYFLGINQIYDADIDRVNKPYLPIPAGDLSMKQGWFLVISTLVAGLLIFPLMNADVITTSLYCLGLLFSTLYSVPPFRFKRHSLATSIVLPLTCGVVHNVGVLYATRASLGLPFSWSPPTVFITAFATLFFVVISTMKDLPDVEGDMKHNIRTFTAIIGPEKITILCTGLLLLNYIGTMAASIFMPQAFKSNIVVLAHATFILWLLFQASKLDKANYTEEASANFFQFLWKLLDLEFLLFPFI